MKKHLNKINRDYFMNKPIPGFESYVIDEYKAQGGNAFLFKASDKEMIHKVACKIIPRDNLSPNWIEEVQKANKLEHPSVVKCPMAGKWVDEENKIDCLYLVLDFVDGVSLRDYISNPENEITVNFIEDLLKTIFELFFEMKGMGIEHGDLHYGNIMVEGPKKFSLTPKITFRVTDFAVKSALFSLGSEDDYLELAKILRVLLKAVDYQNCEMRDRFAFNFIENNLLNHLIEKDKTRDSLAEDPEKLFSLLNSIDDECSRKSADSEKTILDTPFDYLSCEHIGGSHSILKVLFSNRFNAFNDIENRNNIILTGPRGCGKSTIFKSLSLKHRFLTSDYLPENFKYLGVYYRCDDLYFTFPRFEKPKNPNGIDVPVHYLTATLLVGVLESVELWASKNSHAGFSQLEERLSGQLWDLLSLERPRVPNSDTFKALISNLGKERKRARDKRKFLHDPCQGFGNYFGVEILIKCCDAILQGLPFLEKRPFYFFIDDYSSPKITTDLQLNLNRLLMIRESSVFFKISTESSVSFVNEDVDGKAYVEGREYQLTNLGLNFIEGETESNLAFIEDILNRRLGAVPSFPVKSVNDLIGENSNHSENKSALTIRDGKKVEYWGKTILSKLCSGDIFYVILLVGSMVKLAGGNEGVAKVASLPKIKASIQNKAIRKEAGNFLKNLHELPNGKHLIDIVTAFCSVAKSYIVYKNSKNETRNPPYQASKIELREDLKLSEEAGKYYDELLRYSVFFEDVRGKSLRGKFTPRLFLRRFLIPQFRLTFSKRDNIGMEPSELEMLLINPNEFEKNRVLKKFKSDDSESQQEELFGDSDPTMS